MAYITAAEVAAEVKGLTIGAATLLTDTKVGEWIDQEEATINARLRKRYEVPITDADDLEVIKPIALGKVVQRVREWQAVKTGSDETDQTEGTNPGKRAEDMLKLIEKGQLVLNTDRVTTHSGVRSYLSDNPNADDTPPTFKKGTESW